MNKSQYEYEILRTRGASNDLCLEMLQDKEITNKEFTFLCRECREQILKNKTIRACFLNSCADDPVGDRITVTKKINMTKNKPTPKCPNRKLAKLRKQGKELNSACLSLIAERTKAREEQMKKRFLKYIKEKKDVAKV